MDCPVCRNAMITLELAEVEIDHCIDCGGIWLDAGELELMLGQAEKAKDLLHSFKIDYTSTEKMVKCPICDKKMQKIIVGDSRTPVLIDKCRTSDGLWFDKNELQNIVEKAQLDGDNKISKLLSDMFGQSQPGRN